MRLSIIIPTLNEAAELPRTLASIFAARAAVHELIVVDARSTDATVAIATEAGARVITEAPSRGRQLRTGVAAATGDTLLLLHADTRLPAGYATTIDTLLNRPGVVAGAFRLGIDAPGRVYRCIEWGANLRSRLLQRPWGDQALFMRCTTCHQIGSIPDRPALEDVHLVHKLRHHGRIVIANTPITTSRRRWQTQGPLRTTLHNQWRLLCDGLSRR